ncbi:MAG TPA: Rieske 2Fe-2S domain-containing protein [Acidimicrobiales bacterium]|nr:Rieske 2Fe-2S domain-containing protein [Acidimicrobiales bacterium]
MLVPLRVFLGITFCFAGLQKLANPGFFDAANPVSIQSQLAGAARRSPVHALIAPLVHVAVPLGLLISLGEIAVGVGALLGLWTRVAAAGGLVLSLMLFLTVSFHSSPYYTGSDIVFVFGWTPLLLAGSGGAVSVDALIANGVRRRAGLDPAAVVPIAFSTVSEVCGSYDNGTCKARRGAPCEPAPCPFLIGRSGPAPRSAESQMDRRTFAAQGTVAAAAALVALLGGGLAAGVGRLLGGTTAKRGPRALGSTTNAAPTSTAPPATQTPPTSVAGSAVTSPSTTTTRPRPPGTAIGAASQVPVGGAGSFSDPNSGDPSLVIQAQKGSFVAFDLVCPHAGCVVQYDTAAKILVCPCHGSRFNSTTGAVEQGPAASGLLKIRIAEGNDGQLYVT